MPTPMNRRFAETRWLRRLLVLGTLGVLLWFAVPQVLPGVAGYLDVSQPPQVGSKSAWNHAFDVSHGLCWLSKST